MRPFRACSLLLAGLLLGSALPAASQWAPSYQAIRGMDESFRIDIGGFFQKFDTTLQFYKSDGTPGTEFNLEDVLGQDAHQTTLRVDGIWRFGRHGNLQFSYRGWKRSADYVLSQDVTIGDDVYHVGAQVSSKLRQDVPALYYGYSFLNDGELELGLMLGIAAYFNSFEINASGAVSGGAGGTAQVVQSSQNNFVAPIPAIGGYFNFTLLPRFFLYAKAKGMPKVTISQRSASTIDVIAGLDYYFTKNVGIGGGYEYSKITYTHPVPDGERIEIKYSGPLAYLTLAF